jgi:cellulose synthase operon protein C
MKKVLLIGLAALALAGCDRFVSAESRVRRAEEAIARGDQRAAVVELMNALQKDPSLAEARLLLAESALWLGDPGGAQRELERLTTPPDARRVLLAARVALAMGRTDEAVKILQGSTLTFAPGQRELTLGRAHLRLRQPEAAQRWYGAAAAADPKLVEARAGVLEAMAVKGDRAGALAGLAELTRAEPESAAAWMSQGLLLVAAGDTPAASVALERANKQGERQLDFMQRATVLATLVEVQLLEGKLDAARASQQQLARLAPDALGSRYVAARVAMAANDYTAAVNELRKIIEVAPALAQARLLMAMALIAQGNLEQAGRELATLVEQAPDNVVARQLLAQVRMRLDDPDGALRLLVPALGAGGTGEVNALIDAARSQLGAAQSVTLLEQMYAQEPGNDALRTQLATAYLQAGLPAKAVELLKGAGDAPDVRRAAVLVTAIAAAEGSPAARAQVDALIAAHPADAQLAQLAATFYVRSGDVATARKVLAAALARGGDPGALLFVQAQLEWSAGNRAAADAALAKLLARDPGNSAAHMAAGQIALARSDLATARTHFEAVRKTRPESVDARLMLAQVALAQVDGARADELIAEALKLAPQNAAVRNATGMLNLNFGRIDRALEQFRAAVELDAEDPSGWFNLARTQRALGQSGPARDSLDKALVAKPNWLPAIAALVALDIEARESDAAFARIEEFKKAEPGNAAAFVLEGDVHNAIQRFPAAAASYEKAYGLAPTVAVAVKDYRTRTAGNLPTPTLLLDRWLAAHPGDLEARAALADAAIRRKDYGPASEHYRALLAARPNDVVTMNNLAWIYHELGDPRALPLARAAVKLAPKSAAVNDTLGWMLVEGGAAAEGLPYLQAAAAAKDASSEIRFHHAVALARTGSSAEARRTLEGLLRMPDFPSRAEAEKLLRELASGASAGASAGS